MKFVPGTPGWFLGSLFVSVLTRFKHYQVGHVVNHNSLHPHSALKCIPVIIIASVEYVSRCVATVIQAMGRER